MLLSEVPQRDVGTQRDRARGGGLDTGQTTQQGGFSSTVPSHHTNTVTASGVQADLFEDSGCAVGDR